MLKLKLQYTGHLMQRTDLFEKTLMLGKIEDGRRRGRQRDGWMASLTQWTWVWVNSGSWWWTGRPDVLQSMGSQRVGRDWATELNWYTHYKMLLGCNLKNDRMISVCFQGKSFSLTVIQVYALTSNAEEAERFYEDLQELLELTPKKDYRGLECKSRKSRNTWSNRQIWPWSTKRSRSKANGFC